LKPALSVSNYLVGVQAKNQAPEPMASLVLFDRRMCDGRQYFSRSGTGREAQGFGNFIWRQALVRRIKGRQTNSWKRNSDLSFWNAAVPEPAFR
jgi:hypothetical protein